MNDMETQDKYRFDDAYGTIYELIAGAYIYLGSYNSYDITAKMRDTTKVKRVEKKKDK